VDKPLLQQCIPRSDQKAIISQDEKARKAHEIKVSENYMSQGKTSKINIRQNIFDLIL